MSLQIGACLSSQLCLQAEILQGGLPVLHCTMAGWGSRMRRAVSAAITAEELLPCIFLYAGTWLASETVQLAHIAEA